MQENVSPEESAMHRAYDATRKPFPGQKPGKHRQALPSVGLPRRKVKRGQQLPPKIVAKIRAAIEQMKEDLADENVSPSTDLADAGVSSLTDAGDGNTLA